MVNTETLLIVDTSTQAGSLALCRGDEVLGECFLNVRRTHSETLLPALQGLLESTGCRMEEIDVLGCIIGPGSFTGVRIAVATVQGLALKLGCAVATANSLETLAHNLPGARYPVCALIDARKDEVYAAVYEGPGLNHALIEPCVMPPLEFLEAQGQEMFFIGDGALRYRTLIVRQRGCRAHFLPAPFNSVRASSALPLLRRRIESGETLCAGQLVPLYIRPSDAEISLAKRLKEPSIEG